MEALSAADARILDRVANLTEAGETAQAALLITTVSPSAHSHPQILYVAAHILIAQGRTEDAQRTLQAVVQMVPGHSDAWNVLGNIAATPTEATEAYQRATSLAPNQPEYWINLGSALFESGAMEEASQALARAVALAPKDPRPSTYRGLIAQKQGAQDTAVSHFRTSLAISPQYVIARHNLASALRAADRREDALTELAQLLDPQPASITLRAHILAEMGQFDEAINLYHRAILEDPGQIDAHDTLARLLPQLGRSDEALNGFRAALTASPDNRNLWNAAIEAAKDLKQADQMVEWCDAAAVRFGEDLYLELARAMGLNLQGKHDAALDQLSRLANMHPEEAGIRNHLAPLLIKAGDLITAESHLLEAVHLSPMDQAGWAWLSIVWQLRKDPREAWLADYDRLVMPVDLDLPHGLESVLNEAHTTQTHPADQSPRGGTQTRGNLFDRRQPEILALIATLKQAVETQLARLTPDPTHPFLSRLGQGIDFAGSWSVRLADAGYHTCHIHQAGWLSSVCYVAIPPELGKSVPTNPPPAGALIFGVPDESLGLNLTPQRVEVPRAGRLILFPSYFWHGTVPFKSAFPRLTVAFDAMPRQ